MLCRGRLSASIASILHAKGETRESDIIFKSPQRQKSSWPSHSTIQVDAARTRASSIFAPDSRGAVSSPVDDSLLKRNHRWHSAMLPATACAAHATLAGSSLLRSRATDGNDLFRVRGPLCGRPIRSIRRLRLRGLSIAWHGLRAFAFIFLHRSIDDRQLAALDH